MATATLSTKGQLTIPVDVRRKLGISTGGRIQFVENSDGGFSIIPATEDIRELRGIVPKSGRKNPLSIDDMNKIIRKKATGR